MATGFSLSAFFQSLKNAPRGAWAAVAVGLALAASYASNLADLIRTWSAEPNYSHGFLVIPIAAAIFWQRRDGLKDVPIRPSLIGWLGLAGLLVFRSFLYEANKTWLETATMPAAAAMLVLALGGWRLLWWGLPGLLFLWLMLPLPVSVNLMLTGPLQGIATLASSALLTATGLPIVTEGNVIYVGAQPLEVARACNGLSILMSFVTLVTATVLFARDYPLWQRIILLLSTVPIALIANILRITATAWCYHLFGHEIGNKIGHDTAGWLMMPIALALVWIELKIMTWLVFEETIDRRASVRMPLQPAPVVIKK